MACNEEPDHEEEESKLLMRVTQDGSVWSGGGVGRSSDKGLNRPLQADTDQGCVVWCHVMSGACAWPSTGCAHVSRGQMPALQMDSGWPCTTQGW